MNKILCIIFMVEGIYSEVSIIEQLEHVLKRRQENQGLANDLMHGFRNTRRVGGSQNSLLPQRRYDFYLDHNDASAIIGAPSLPSHLPEAEAILPGHTLIRPALGMLKSAVKFPHRELENGAGVLGNYNNLGIKYDGKNERVLYTGFRRNAPSFEPSQKTRRKSSYLADSSVKNNRGSLYEYIMNNQDEMNEKVLERLKLMKKPVKQNKRLIMYVADPSNSPFQLSDLMQEKNSVYRLKDDILFTDKHLSAIKTAPTYYYLNSVEQEAAGNLPNTRREDIVEPEGADDDDDDGDGDDEDSTTEKQASDKTKEEKGLGLTKREKFYATKNLYNTVKIHQDMFTYEDLVPDIKSKEYTFTGKDRPWWFYNEVDFDPFHHFEN